ncbi:MAG: hypothetical protein RL222_1192 [Bacteroidota bacterium]|jgi:hypothetical protein
MKKTIYLAVLFLVIGMTATSCKKDETDPVTVVGFWQGKYSNVSTPTTFSFGYAALLRSDGTCRFFSSTDTTTASKAEGTYSLTGSTLNATYTYISPGSGTYSVTATVNSVNAYMEGTWGSGTSTTNGGSFFLHKP